MRGPMEIGNFERLVRDATRPCIGGPQILRHAKRYSNAPADTFTFVFGDWDDGNWYNVPIPLLPEETQRNPNGTVACYGWRELLRDFVRDQMCVLTPAIEKALDVEAHKFRQELQSRGIWV